MGMLDSVEARHDVGDVHATQNYDVAMKEEALWKRLRRTAATPFAPACGPVTPPGTPIDSEANASTLELLPPRRRPGPQLL